MALVSKNRLKEWFAARKYPTALHFASLFDSFWHKTDDIIPLASVDDLPERLNNKLDTAQAALMRQDIANNRILINSLNSSLNALDVPTIEAAVDSVNDALVNITEMETLARQSAQLLPLRLTLQYLARITYGNNAKQKITANLLPTYQIPNVLFLGDGNAVDVLPDGTVEVLKTGKSRVHIIPTTNTALYKTINIEVVEPSVALASLDSFLMVGDSILLT